MQDVHWLLEQEDAELFFTRDRERIFPRPRQQEVCETLREAFDGRGVRLVEWAGKFDLGVESLRRLIGNDTSLAYATLEDGFAYSEVFLRQVRLDVLNHLLNSGDARVCLKQAKGDLPDTYTERICQEIIAEEGNDVEGTVERKTEGVFFTPQSALSSLQKEKERAKGQFVTDALRALDKDGYCNVTTSHIPKILHDSDPTHLKEAIIAAYSKEHAEKKLTAISDSSNLNDKVSSHESDIYLVEDETLSKKQDELVESAGLIATKLWETRVPGQDVEYNLPAFLKALAEETPDTSSNATSFTNALLHSPHSTAIHPAFEQKITDLQTTTTQALADLLRTKLLGPLTLYTKGLETLNDPTLQPRVQEHLTDWARRTLIPTDILLPIKERKLSINKTTTRELDRFSDSISTAKTLEAVLAATQKLARKLKIELPDSIALTEMKKAALKEKVKWMRKAKRGSDLLQNLTWVMLACRREGLFVSSGKDTSRMIKVFVGDCEGDEVVGKRLGEMRDLVKEGKDGDRERGEMREMAVNAVEGLV